MPHVDLVPGDDLIAQPGHRARIGNHGVYKTSCGNAPKADAEVRMHAERRLQPADGLRMPIRRPREM